MKQFDSSIVGQPYSEVVSAALGLPKPWHKSPGNLFDWAMLQPGARIVPDDELLIPWSAS